MNILRKFQIKRQEFINIIKSMGFVFYRHGKHEVWSNGTRHIAIPSSKEINRMVARRLLKEIGYPSVGINNVR